MRAWLSKENQDVWLVSFNPRAPDPGVCSDSSSLLCPPSVKGQGEGLFREFCAWPLQEGARISSLLSLADFYTARCYVGSFISSGALFWRGDSLVIRPQSSHWQTPYLRYLSRISADICGSLASPLVTLPLLPDSVRSPLSILGYQRIIQQACQLTASRINEPWSLPAATLTWVFYS